MQKNYTETTMEKQQSKYRFERKFTIKPEFLFSFIAQITASGFSEIYEQRFINNVYLDDYNFSNVLENVEGISNRKKTRIRWYGELFSDSKKTIEFKIKSDDVNRKDNIKLDKFLLSTLEDIDLFWDAIKTHLENTSNEKYYTHQLFMLNPTLLNSYTRNYYLNPDESIRITIDKDLFYYSPIYLTKTHDSHIIIEIKYNAADLVSENMFSHLALTKYSKYVKGILSTTTFKPIY